MQGDGKYSAHSAVIWTPGSLEATPFLLAVIMLAPSVARPVSFDTSNFDSSICVNTVDLIVSALADSEFVRRFLVNRNCVVALLLSGATDKLRCKGGKSN